MTKKEITAAQSFVDMGVEVTTTGYMGGDKGHGGQTIIKLSNDTGCSYIEAAIDDQYPREVTDLFITVRGDRELDDLIDSLAFALRHLCKATGRRVDFGTNDRYSRFHTYLDTLVKSYHLEGNKSLRGISELAKEHNVSCISKSQFFQFDLDNKKHLGGISFDKSKEIYDFIKQRSR